MKKKRISFIFLIGLISILWIALQGQGIAAEKDPIRIGFFGPLTGRFSVNGTEAEKGCKLAIKEINEAGGIDGRQIKLYEYDDRADRKEAVSVALKLIELDKVVAIVNGSLSLTSISAAPVVNSKKVPMIVSYANAVGAVKGYPYSFRMASVGDVQGWIMAYHAVQKRGYKNFALFIQDEEYGRGLGNGMVKGLEKWRGNIVYQKFFQPAEKEFRSYLTEAKALNPDAVFVSGFGPALSALAMQGYDIGLFPKNKKAQFYGG